MGYSNVPQELKKMNRWVLYRLFWEEDRGKYTKKPYNARTGGFAQSNNPSTWCDYETALGVANHYDGLGFMLGEGIFGVDIDGVELDNPVVQDVMTTLNSYAEVSPSGKGIHVICKGTKPQGACRKGNFECYEKGRFFTVTGKVIEPYRELRECTETIKPLFDRYLRKDEPQTITSTPSYYVGGELLSDSDIIDKASRQAKFNDLYYYGWGSGDASRDDMALIDHLIFWTGGNISQVDRIYRQSALMRPKWERRQRGRTYGEITIDKCMSTYTGGYYNPQHYRKGVK
ncbi:MAG: hypothetical protein ACRDDX_08615 [Cellulosilyticaceae bacterium]